ncbi:hypothetical protein WCT90_15570 [Pectobacterium carotovorum]|uniref:hypothetical protein n=1 Tax=Pectobacterium carotovorum TaxID=554 RepID=UPI003016BC58
MFILDSDVARKLCQYSLLDELLRSTEIPLSNFFILPQLRFQLKINAPTKAIKLLGSEEAYNSAQKLILECHEINIPSSDFTNQILTTLNAPDIDSGEATLFTAIIIDINKKLITGDKRAIKALSSLINISSSDIWLRVLTFEEALLTMLHSHPFDLISNKIRGRNDVDTGISIIFGRSVKNSKESVIEGLTSNINELKRATSHLYCFPKNGS